MRRPIANNSRPGEAVYDPFLGSGTTLIAAEMSGRVCYGVELDPAYVDVAVRRWQRFTGRDAVHQGSSQSLTNVPSVRSVGAEGLTMSRKAFVVDDATRERVRYLAGVGVPQDDIARIVGCAPKTLRKRFRDDLDRGIAEANATVCVYLFAAVKAGNISAIIFWLKSRVHWRERGAVDAAPTPADAAANSPVLLVLPDNSRDPELTQVLRQAQDHYFAGKPFGKPDPVSRESKEGQTGMSEAGIAASAYAAGTLFSGNQGQHVSASGA